ncbi:VOC family protein [Komagataeibacter xylinus]|uniref:Glyoxalase n=1 Tax=Komagataeibacter xylinus TaxID=28448 RepID=A0A857FMA1_KOMXY|nr:glyoxalase [Komagataeibacter xylinus]QHC35295.1 glyoxalase [Komagataeibacter xylinus]
MSKPFHLAFPVNDLDAARYFYGSVLQCPEGRSSDTWIDFDLYGNQIVAHRILSARLQQANARFGMEPQIRFAGLPDEQTTMFVYDPAGNALELKAFNDMNLLLASNPPAP